MTDTYMNLPAPSLRALHSGLVDYLQGVDPMIRDSFLVRLGGIDFPHLALALRDDRFAVTTRIVGEDAMLGLAVTTRGRFDRPLFELPAGHGGVDAPWLIAAGLLDLDDDLDEILGGDER